jgi:hypothetical protein
MAMDGGGEGGRRRATAAEAKVRGFFKSTLENYTERVKQRPKRCSSRLRARTAVLWPPPCTGAHVTKPAGSAPRGHVPPAQGRVQAMQLVVRARFVLYVEEWSGIGMVGGPSRSDSLSWLVRSWLVRMLEPVCCQIGFRSSTRLTVSGPGVW